MLLEERKFTEQHDNPSSLSVNTNLLFSFGIKNILMNAGLSRDICDEFIVFIIVFSSWLDSTNYSFGFAVFFFPFLSITMNTRWLNDVEKQIKTCSGKWLETSHDCQF